MFFKKTLLIVLFSLLYLSNSFGQIVLTGNWTGAQLRTYVKSDGYGTVVANTIFFNQDLVVKGTLTDANAIYSFQGDTGFFPNGGTVNFTDVTIIYEENPKGDSKSRPFTANWERVSFIQSVNSGRSDFFNNGDYNFNFNDVTLVSYGANDVLHFQSNSTIRNIKIASPSNSLSFEPGAVNNGDTQNIIDLQLRGVNTIVGGAGANGDLVVENLDWDNLNWTFNVRNVDMNFINPVKPVGWVGYQNSGVDGCSRVKEYYTHDLIVLNENRDPIQSAGVYLLNDVDNSFDYRSITNSGGKVSAHNVLKIDNSRGLNFDRGTWQLLVAVYDREYFVKPRSFNNKISEEVILLQDEYVSETNATVVNNYSKIENAAALYDRAKLWKVQNTNVLIPDILSLLISQDFGELNLPPSWDLVIDPSAAQVFDVTGTTITIKTNVLQASDKFSKLICTGDIDLLNNAVIDFPYSDKINNSYVRILEVTDTDTIYFRDFDTNDVIKKNIGSCGYAYPAQSKNLIVELKRENGDSALKYYDMSKSGLDNYFYMGINTIRLETMFKPADRTKLFTLIDDLILYLERKDGQIHDVLTWMRALTHKLQPNKQ